MSGNNCRIGIQKTPTPNETHDRGKPTKDYTTPGEPVGCAAFSPDGTTIVAGTAKLLKGHKNWVVSLAFSADSKRLKSGAGDSTVRAWDVPGGKEIGRLRFGDSSTYTHAVGLSPEGDIAFALVEPGHLLLAKVPQPKR